MGDLMTAKELGRLWSFTEMRIQKLARDGFIPCIRKGRRVWFDRDELEKWVNDGGSDEPVFKAQGCADAK